MSPVLEWVCASASLARTFAVSTETMYMILAALTCNEIADQKTRLRVNDAIDDIENKGSFVGTHLLLNLLNELRKRTFYRFFTTSLIINPAI